MTANITDDDDLSGWRSRKSAIRRSGRGIST